MHSKSILERPNSWAIDSIEPFGVDERFYMMSKVLATLPRWKFRPAMRGTTPVEVNAILGFNVDTSDRR